MSPTVQFTLVLLLVFLPLAIVVLYGAYHGK